MKIAGKGGPQADLVWGLPFAFMVACWWMVVGVPEQNDAAEDTATDMRGSATRRQGL